MATTPDPAASAQTWLRQHQADVISVLGGRADPSAQVHIVVSETHPDGTPVDLMDTVVEGNVRTIYINPTWFAAHPKEVEGAFVHEMAHAYNAEGSEVRSDAVRYAVMGDEPVWKPTPEQKAIGTAMREHAVPVTSGPDLSAAEATAADGTTTPAPEMQFRRGPGGELIPIAGNAAAATTAAAGTTTYLDALVGLGAQFPPEVTNDEEARAYVQAHPEILIGLGTQTQQVSDAEQAQQHWVDQAIQTYEDIWGQPAPTHWIHKLKDGQLGDTLQEVEEHERMKPAFKKTQTYKDEYASTASSLASELGLR